MALEDIDNTAFTCHMGTYEYLMMAFVLRQPPKPALVSRSYCGLPG